ncbi:hypothetical protein GJ496_004355 [Pomphorhynchus laevis]|nr:hypothetical protein GJ496_004355 [Pomphorhynchus laevis]
MDQISNSEQNRFNNAKRVMLNIGGTLFTTTIQTLKKENNIILDMLEQADNSHCQIEGSTNEDKVIYFDRDPNCFRHILNYLRNNKGALTLPQDYKETELLLNEAYYYKMFNLVGIIENALNDKKLQNNYDLKPSSPSIKHYNWIRPAGLTMAVTFKTYKSEIRQIVSPAILLPAILTKSVDKNQLPLQNCNSTLLEEVNLLWPNFGKRALCSTNLSSIAEIKRFVRKHCKIEKGYYCHQFVLESEVYTRKDILDRLHIMNAHMSFRQQDGEIYNEGWIL